MKSRYVTPTIPIANGVYSMTTPIKTPAGQRERGFVLVTALIFLVILTLVVLSVANVTSSEEKIARNFRDSDIALAAAEAAMRDAELQITGEYQIPGVGEIKAIDFDSSCTNGLCDSSNAPSGGKSFDQLDFFDTANAGGIQANSIRIGSITGSPTIKGILDSHSVSCNLSPCFTTDQQPRYMIELVNDTSKPCGTGGCAYLYRITAQAIGQFPNTRVVLQELYQPSIK